MRVVSMVPSWTETLLTAGIEVIGRTRYCIHPADRVASIPVVGGTKDWDWEKIKTLKPDLILLDREENPKFMSEQDEISYLATHVTDVSDLPKEIAKIESLIPNVYLRKLTEEWRQVKPYQGDIPGVIQWGRKPSTQPQTIYYVIWKNPWMIVSRDTFVGSMLAYCGVEVPQQKEKYPKLDLTSIANKEETLLLFSSEPYPFLNHQDEIAKLGFPYAIIDGEKFSWFGIRSLRFLQELQ